MYCQSWLWILRYFTARGSQPIFQQILESDFVEDHVEYISQVNPQDNHFTQNTPHLSQHKEGVG